MTELLKDVSTLTTIPKTTLDRLTQKAQACICHTVEENRINYEPISSFDIGIGTLNILASDEEVKYKFIPSESLESAIKETVISGESPLILDVEEALREKVMNVYKELF